MASYTHDLAGREYARLNALKAGDKIIFDGGFTCGIAGKTLTIEVDDGRLYVPCVEGRHFLHSQLQGDGDYLVGVYLAEPKVQFVYKNHRGEVELRTVEPVSLDWVASPHLEYGYGPGWFLHCRDFSRGRQGEPRSFALANIQMTDFDTHAAGKLANTAFRLKLR